MDKVLTRVENLRGGTRTDLALNAAMAAFDEESLPGRQKVIIVITDGKATAPLQQSLEMLHHHTDIKVQNFYLYKWGHLLVVKSTQLWKLPTLIG